MPILRRFVLVFVCIFTLLLSGCGGGGGDSQEKKGPVAPPINTDGGPPLTKVALGQEVTGNQSWSNTAGVVVTLSNNVVTVTIKTHGQGQIFGYQFYVAYDPQHLEYAGCDRGGFLGVETVFPIMAMDTNKHAADLAFSGWQKSIYLRAILVSESRSGWDTSGASGDGNLAVLRFNVVSGTTTELLFAEPLLFEKKYVGELPSSKSMDIPRYIQFTPT